jgi:HEAT repeats
MSRVPSSMRIFLAAGTFCVGLTALAQRAAVQPVPPAPPNPNISRGPVIGMIDYYGLRKIPLATVQKALGVHEGDLLPFSKGDVEQRLDDIPGIVESHLEAVCCANGKVTLYVGIEERGAGHFELHDVPDGDAMLPEEVDLAYRRFLDASDNASRQGLTREDLTKGYARSEDPFVRAIQESFPSLVKQYLPEIRSVLRNSDDEAQRATAAYVIAYAPDPKTVVNDLQYALRDPDPGVRVNAARSLVGFAVAGVKVEVTWFVEMLNSLSWTDRTRALGALELLTDSRGKTLDPRTAADQKAVLDQIRTRAFPALVEMARWKTLEHALPAYMLLSRVAGIADQQAQDAWSRGDRESVIGQALKSAPPPAK